MGAICPCFGKEPEYTYSPVPSSNSERTPLLASGSYGSTKKSNGGAVTSARLHSKSDPPPDKAFGENDLRRLEVNDTGVPNVDKQFKDHVILFNDFYLERYNQLKRIISKMMSTYDNTGVTPSNLVQIFNMLKGTLSEEATESLKAARKFKYCMEINFEAKLMDTDSIAILDGFNKANRLAKELLEKGPTLVETVAMVEQNEDQAKRDVTVYYAEYERKEQGPEKLKACLGNFGELKRVKPSVMFIKKEARSIFDDLKDAAHVLFRGTESEQV